MSVVRSVICDTPRVCTCCGKEIPVGAEAVKYHTGTTRKAERRRRIAGKPLKALRRQRAGERTAYYIPEHWAHSGVAVR